MLAGLLVGAMVVVHGTELYTSAIVLILLAVAKWRQLAWGRLPGHLGLALAISLSCAAPYLPALLHWAGTGAAYQVGQDEGAVMQAGATSAGTVQQLGILTLDALGVDLPVRAILLPLGVAWAIRRRTGRILIVVAGLFLGLAAVGTFLNGVAVVRTVYAATYPWSVPYRHLTVAAVPLAVLGGAGCVVLTQIWQGAWSRLRGASQRRARRLGRLLVPAWLIVATWAVTALLAVAAGLMASFSADDAAAMGWLRQHAAPGEVMVNDAFADAGIWAPYKAGVGILRYESFSDPATDAERRLIEENVAGLDRNPNAAAAACRLNVRYVYRGAQNSAWQELRASGGLEEVFSSGEAAVFRTRLEPLC